MKQKELSIIIPVYNAEKYIGRCLQSILNCPETEFEVIVVDDGSKDASLSVCKKIATKDSRVNVFGKENGGVSSARNFGLDNAHGRYITFCDADDYYEDGAISFLMSELKSADNDLIFFPFYLEPMNSPKKVYGVKDIAQSQQVELTYIRDNFWKLLNEGMINSSWNRIFQRERIEKMKLRFRTDMTFSEDGLFNVMYLRDLNEESKILYLARPLYNYVSNEGQATRKKVKRYFYMMCLAFDNIDEFVGENRKSETYWKEWLSVVKDTLYHQNYTVENADEILSNRRTKEMLKCYHPADVKSKLVVRKIMQGKLEELCRYYKMSHQIKSMLRRMLKGRKR